MAMNQGASSNEVWPLFFLQSIPAKKKQNLDQNFFYQLPMKIERMSKTKKKFEGIVCNRVELHFFKCV